MHSSAVGSSFCSNITWPENNRECLLIKAASLKAASLSSGYQLQIGHYTPEIPDKATACPKELTVSPDNALTCFKVWLEN